MQASLAALHERLESLESGSQPHISSNLRNSAHNSNSRNRGRNGQPASPRRGGGRPWEGWGMWGIVFRPVAALVRLVQSTACLLASPSSPGLAVLRRL
ncbi:hypothetical protein DACRYDRAFT_19388, partial [Dacryopinax primogenitus]